MPSQSPPAENSNASKLTGYGIAGTVFYLGILVGVFFRVGAAPFVGKQLNEWGDFLAGVFGPLALLWLALGYFIQAKELRAQGRRHAGAGPTYFTLCRYSRISI